MAKGVRLLYSVVAAATAAAGAEERVFFSFFSKNSEGTLENFVVPVGRLFGTKLGGVLAFVVLPFWAGLG